MADDETVTVSVQLPAEYREKVAEALTEEQDKIEGLNVTASRTELIGKAIADEFTPNQLAKATAEQFKNQLKALG